MIGYQVRRTKIAEATYTWFEHLLHNPTQGFRWLVESNGHWTLAKTAAGDARTPSENARPSTWASATGHFQTAKAETAYVIGEFPGS